MEKTKNKNETNSKEKEKDKNEKDKDRKVKIAEISTNTGFKIFEKIFDFLTAKEKYKHSEESSKYEILKQNNESNIKRIQELEELFKKMIDEKNKNKPDIINGIKE